MLSKKIEEAFNKQINKEFYSSYLYLSMAAYFESKNLKGFASWMKIQVDEENSHAMKFFDFVNQRGSKVKLLKIEAPKTSWINPTKVFEEVLAHEKFITKSITELYNLTQKENDIASSIFLNWFIQEQIEEENTAKEILEKLKLIKDDQATLYLLDKELASRQDANQKK